MNRKIWFVLGVFLCGVTVALPLHAKDYSVKSPDGKISLTVTAGKQLSWQASMDGQQVIRPSFISMTFEGGNVIGAKPHVSSSAIKTVSESIKTPFYRKRQVADHYTQLVLKCKGYDVEFRAYDDAVAYRFVTAFQGKVKVQNEQVEFNFDKDYKAFIPYINDLRAGERYSFAFESYYTEQKLSEMYADSISIAPLCVDLGNGRKATVLECGCEDYPGMFLKMNPNGENGIMAEFAPYPLEGYLKSGFFTSNYIATKRADFIAQTQGTRSFPWRAVVLTEKDKDLAMCDIAQKLAAPCRLKDLSWIKPGKVAWDWWNNWNVTGVDFKTGINTQTYKYYIDFAAENHLEYIIVDSGWSSQKSLMEVIPEMDLPELVRYGNEKHVGVILWAGWDKASVEKDKVFPYYAKMGIKGFKVDFIDCDDQKMLNSVVDIVKCAADNHLVLDFHGWKANGLQRTYPNILNFEGVKGLENFKWNLGENQLKFLKERLKGVEGAEAVIKKATAPDVPHYDVIIPYLRMLVGQMDYTPGAMKNATRDNYYPLNGCPMSQGTRVHQMAMYTVYDAPLQMLSDTPNNYRKEQECTDFISSVPTVSDETRVLDGQVGAYIVTARRLGSTWFVGAMNDWIPRKLTVDFSFLGKGSYTADIFADGINSDKEPTDYKHTTLTVTADSKVDAELFPAGGWTARITPNK